MEDGEFVVSRILEVRFPKGKPREFLIRLVGIKPQKKQSYLIFIFYANLPVPS